MQRTMPLRAVQVCVLAACCFPLVSPIASVCFVNVYGQKSRDRCFAPVRSGTESCFLIVTKTQKASGFFLLFCIDTENVSLLLLHQSNGTLDQRAFPPAQLVLTHLPEQLLWRSWGESTEHNQLRSPSLTRLTHPGGI
jgi:hypothetical protein